MSVANDTPKVLTFHEALSAAGSGGKNLLVGNGFSIACRSDIFRYDRLFEQADFKALSPSARAAFDALGTMDFERVIKGLRDAARLGEPYGQPAKTLGRMRTDADALKELLVQTIASSHPSRPNEIDDDEYAACKKFLSHFDTVYSLNYDLLLYWTDMHGDDKPTSDDGFRGGADDPLEDIEADYLVWNSGQSHEQNRFYLHGALHFFDSGTEVQKFAWNRTGLALIDQIRDALNKDRFPIFVSEGTSDEKVERIRHSDFLAKAHRSFVGISKPLFVYGLSFAENDEHILRTIEGGKVRKLFVSLYGPANSKANRSIIRRANALADQRSLKKSLEVKFFQAESAKVWG